MSEDWTQQGKVRAREGEGGFELVIDGLTTQSRYYKPLVYEFFRKSWRGGRPAWGGAARQAVTSVRMESARADARSSRSRMVARRRVSSAGR